MVEIHLLDGRVAIDGCEFTYEAGWLALALALAAPDWVRVSEIDTPVPRREGGASPALRKRVSRLREAGLDIQFERGRGYRLVLEGVRVDALAYLDLFRRVSASDKPEVDSRALVAAADRLWRAGLPRLERGLPEAAKRTYEELGAAHAAFGRFRAKRILIIDDQLGEQLASRLRGRNCDCDVATSYQQYETLRSSLSSYDLAVIDRHLTLRYTDRDGESIIKEINASSTALPVMLITWRPPDDMDGLKWQESLGLAGLMYKSADGAEANLAGIVEAVIELVQADPVERSCTQIERNMVDLRRHAQRRLSMAYQGNELRHKEEAMRRDASRVETAARAGDLALAREALSRFQESWNR